MTAFIFRRLAALLPMLLAVTLLVFALMSLAPGDFLTPVKAQRDINPALIAELQKSFGLDRPWYEQYALWLGNVLHLDFGYSWTYKVPVAQLIAQRAPATILLSLTSLLLAWTLAIPLAVLAAARPGGWIDRLTSAAAYFALAIPEFFLALLAVWMAARTGWFPIGGLTSLDHDFLSPSSKFFDIAYHLILPTPRCPPVGICHRRPRQRAFRKSRSLSPRPPQRPQSPSQHDWLRFRRPAQRLPLGGECNELSGSRSPRL
jgi:peptide/nickel transport system permease protein